MFGPLNALTDNVTGLMALVALLFIGIVVFVIKKHLPSLLSESHDEKAGEAIPVFQRPILTQNEMAFFHTLQRAIGGQYLIFPQLALSTFVEGRTQSSSARTSFTNQIDRKRVDFVLVYPHDLRPFLAIEVDDRTHKAEQRRRRDELVEDVLQRAEIKLVRLPAARSYDVTTLRRQLGLFDDRFGDSARYAPKWL